MSPKSERIVRHTAPERVNHWLVAILFILTALGGLTLFHPYFFWLGNLLGGPTLTRILHPFLGVLVFLAFMGLVSRWAADNRLTDEDRQWLNQIGDVIKNREGKLPEAGRYNAGQKCLFWFQLTSLSMLLLSGVVIWRPWFAPYFSIGMIRFAVVVHGLAAFFLMAGIIIHIYAAFWIKGSLTGMLTGTVSRAWAKKFHPAWYRRISGGGE
jgi:formate dehydrogenase subunit gamma